MHLAQGLFIHALGQHRISGVKRVDAVNQVDVQVAHVDELAHAVYQGGVAALFCTASISAWLHQSQLGLLGDVHGGNGVLADCFLVFAAQLRVAIAHNFSHAQLRQLFGQGVFLVKQAALQHRLVLQEAGDDLVQILFADARCLRAFGRGQAVDFDMDLAGVLVNADVVSAGLIACVAVIKAVFGAGVFGGELIARCQHLLHQQAG